MELPPDPSSVGQARDFVRTRLRDLGGSDDSVHAAALLASEVATNVVLHARTDMTVRVARSSTGVRIELADLNTRLPVIGDAPLDATTGRGLAILQLMADNWGVDSTE